MTHTKQTAVKHSPLLIQLKNQIAKRVNSIIRSMTKDGPKMDGGMKDMPPQINTNGAKTVAGQNITLIG